MVLVLSDYVRALEGSHLDVYHVLLHITQSLVLGYFVNGPFVESVFVYLLDFFLKPLASTRNRKNYVILSERVFNEVVEITVGLIHLVNILEHLAMHLQFV